MTRTLGRRELITLLAGTAGAWSTKALAQNGSKPASIAWISGNNDKSGMIYAGYFLNGMRDLGYVEGRSYTMTYHFSGGYQDRLPALAEEVVSLKPDIIIGSAVVAAVAARKVTSTIPIVCPALADAIHLGLVASEARPGGNVTGVEPYVAGLPAKQMEIAREVVPGAKIVGLLTDLKDPKTPPQAKELEAAGRALDVKVITAGAAGPDDLDGAFQTLVNDGVEIIIVLQSTMLLGNSRPIAELASAKRMPVVYGYREHVVAGGLISYGVDLRWCYHRGAYFVDKILHGTKAGDLPVEFPTTLLLSVNITTAKALGLTIPPSLLTIADDVIE
jgi:putative tryptophan/tyrosine transport system substrate-binding protein